MAQENASEQQFPSTTWSWRKVRISRGAGGHTTTAAVGRSFRALSRWNPRTPLPVKVSYRGGPECWYEFHARGAMVRMPGHTTVHDLMSTIYGGNG